ncbi:hypothetical protein BV898_19722, partial [Hypsibius exemplaris]
TYPYSFNSGDLYGTGCSGTGNPYVNFRRLSSSDYVPSTSSSQLLPVHGPLAQQAWAIIILLQGSRCGKASPPGEYV